MPRKKDLIIYHTLCPEGNKDPRFPAISSYWHPYLNKGVALQGVGRAEEKQCYFYRLCKVHLAFQSPKSLIDNGHSSLDCRVCGTYSSWSNTRKGSQYEVAAYEALKAIEVKDEDWLIEARVLKKNYSAVDIWIGKLLIMIDGEGHFDVDTHGTPVHRQREIDNRFNEAAVRSGYSVLRLHYRDSPAYASSIQRALQKSRSLAEPFLEHSYHFHKWGLVHCKDK